jgi:outer membrane murein-binding lipoprotein Lpp
MGRRRRSHAVLRAILVLLLVFVVVCVAAGFTFYQQAEELKTQANDVMADVTTLKQELKSGDTSGAAATASSISTTADAMRSTTEGTLWQLASKLPYIGTDVQNARTLTSVLGDLSDDVLTPVVSTINDAGGLNLSSARSLANMSDELNASLEEAKSTVDAMPEGHISEVNNAVARAKETIGSTSLSSDLTGAL